MQEPQEKIPNPTQLPDSLKAQLKQFRGHLWRIKIMEAVWAGFFGLILSYVLVFALERFIPTTSLVRLLILAAGVSVFAVFAPLWINRWVFKHRRENQIAQLIAKQYPHLGDRLLGVVELQDQDESNTSLSPRLREAAMAQVAAEFGERDLRNALPITWHKKWGLAVLALAAVAISAWTITPKAGFNSLQRWLMPLAEIERSTETSLDKSLLPSPYYVAQGEPFQFTAKLTESSNVPASAKARTSIQGWQSSDELNRSYSFDFPKAFKEQQLELKVGDAFHSILVKPITRPILSELTATITFPSYLQKEDERIDLTSGQTSVIEGASITIVGKTNRPISSASASIQTKDQPSVALKTDIHNSQFTLAAQLIQHDLITLPLNWTDIHGLSNLTPAIVAIEKELDTPPSAYLANTPEAIYTLPDSTIKFDVSADDDFGLKQVGFSWDGTFTKPSPHAAAKGSLTTSPGHPQLKQAVETIDFSFQAYDIAPQKLVIRAWAEDYKPDRPRTYSAPITVYVLTTSEHRELMKQRTQSAINQLEDLMRNEQQLLDENKRLEKLSGEQLQTEESKERLADQAQKERENTESMDDIAKQMQDVFEEASKNDQIDSSTLKDLAKSALKMKQMAQQKMPEISKNLDESQSSENTDQKAKEEVTEAVKKQSELLKEMEEAIQKSSDANKKLEAGTFVNRLKKAAEDEERLAQTLIQLMSKQSPSDDETNFITNEFEALDPALQRTVLSLFAQQQQTGTDIRWIEEDLGHFYLRTQQEEHNTLLNKIKNSSIHSDLNQLLSQMEDSQNYLTIELSLKTAKQLNAWAKELAAAAKKDQNSGGGGGGEGSNGGDPEDFEFMLRVMRLTQQEIAIRSRIRSLEQKKRLSHPHTQDFNLDQTL